MDDRKFDELTKLVGRKASRRTVIRAAIAGAVASVLGGGIAEAALSPIKTRPRLCIQPGQPCAAPGTDPSRNCCYKCNSTTHKCCEDIGYQCTTDANCCVKLVNGVNVQPICRDPQAAGTDRRKACFLPGTLTPGAQCIQNGDCASGNCANGVCSACAVGTTTCGANCCTTAQCQVCVAGVCKSKCGPCQTCNGQGVCVNTCTNCQKCVNNVCVPKCNAALCQTCNPATGVCETCANDKCKRCVNGQCVDKCTKCQDCDSTTGVCSPKPCPNCQTCNPATGACGPKVCGSCQTCDPVDGICKSTCNPCQTCQNGVCVGTTCPTCQTCNPATGTCQATVCGPCEACDRVTGVCESTCGACEFCDGVECVSECSNCETCDEYFGGCIEDCPLCSFCDSYTEQCEPINPTICPPGQEQDPITCQCVCVPIVCPPGQHQDPITCLCICNPDNVCGADCCDPGLVCRDVDGPTGGGGLVCAAPGLENEFCEETVDCAAGLICCDVDGSSADGTCGSPPGGSCVGGGDTFCCNRNCNSGTGTCRCDDGRDICGAVCCAAGEDCDLTDPSNPVCAEPILTITFEPPTYTTGSIHGQDGWVNPDACANYDHEVVTNTYGYATFGTQSFRISNAVTSGCFDSTFSKSIVNEAGETSAANDGQSGGVRQTHFEAQWDFASTVPGSEQVGLSVVASPDRGDGARMSWVQMTDTPTGLAVNFNDYQTVDGTCANGLFVLSPVASGLDRIVPHTIKIVMDFVDGVANDIVEVYVDGVLEHTGTSWEDYFRECESNPTRTVDSILFRTGGTAAPATLGNGFLIDNLIMSS